MTSHDWELYRKAVRARSLTDPLGTMGFRTSSDRIQRESQIRRLAFALTTLGFAGILGAILATAGGGNAAHDAALAANSAANVGFVTNSQQPVLRSGRTEQPSHTRTRGS